MKGGQGGAGGVGGKDDAKKLVVLEDIKVMGRNREENI